METLVLERFDISLALEDPVRCVVYDANPVLPLVEDNPFHASDLPVNFVVDYVSDWKPIEIWFREFGFLLSWQIYDED